MRKCKHIIWDWNGTLLNDQKACVDAINLLLERRRLPTVTVRQYLDIFDFPVKDYYLKLGFDFSKDDWAAVAVEYHAAYAQTSAAAPLRQGTIAALETLKSYGFGMSVLSACELALLKRMMTERHVTSYFDPIYGLDDLYAASKLDLGHALLKNTRLPLAETLMVGDTTHDYEVACALGIPCLLMTGGHQSEVKLAALGCPIASSLTDVVQHVLTTT